MNTGPQPDKEHTRFHSRIVDDEGLVASSQEGCVDCFAVLFRRHCKLVLAIGWRILRQRTEAEDLVQEVFLTIFQKRNPYDPVRGSVKTWIAQFAYLKAHTRRRHLSTRKLTPLEEAFSGDEYPTRGGFELCDVERTAFVEQSLTVLNPRQRRTIELIHFEGYTLLEAAAVLKESLANTRNQYYRGMKSLRSHLSSDQVTLDILKNAAQDAASSEHSDSIIPALGSHARAKGA